MTDETGVIAEGYEPANLAKAIDELMKKKYNSAQLRQYVIDHYAPTVIAKQHIDMYNQKLSPLDS